MPRLDFAALLGGINRGAEPIIKNRQDQALLDKEAQSKKMLEIFKGVIEGKLQKTTDPTKSIIQDAPQTIRKGLFGSQTQPGEMYERDPSYVNEDMMNRTILKDKYDNIVNPFDPTKQTGEETANIPPQPVGSNGVASPTVDSKGVPPAKIWVKTDNNKWDREDNPKFKEYTDKQTTYNKQLEDFNKPYSSNEANVISKTENIVPVIDKLISMIGDKGSDKEGPLNNIYGPSPWGSNRIGAFLKQGPAQDFWRSTTSGKGREAGVLLSEIKIMAMAEGGKVIPSGEKDVIFANLDPTGKTEEQWISGLKIAKQMLVDNANLVRKKAPVNPFEQSPINNNGMNANTPSTNKTSSGISYTRE